MIQHSEHFNNLHKDSVEKHNKQSVLERIICSNLLKLKQ